MPIGSLFETGLSSYLAEEGDRPNDLWLFLHIPKTGGTSLGIEIAHVLRPAAAIEVDYRDGRRSFLDKMDDAVDRFIRGSRDEEIRFVTGHLRMNHVKRIRETHRRTKVVTMLRDPIERILSDYRFQHSPMHPLHRSFRAQFPTLERYVESPFSRCIQHQHLALSADEPTRTLIERLETTFSFVGTLEAYEMSFRLLFKLFGCAREPILHERETKREPSCDAEADERLRARMRELNATDIELYDHFRRKLESRRGELLGSSSSP
jgi:hypothetical protein